MGSNCRQEQNCEWGTEETGTCVIELVQVIIQGTYQGSNHIVHRKPIVFAQIIRGPRMQCEGTLLFLFRLLLFSVIIIFPMQVRLRPKLSALQRSPWVDWTEVLVTQIKWPHIFCLQNFPGILKKKRKPPEPIKSPPKPLILISPNLLDIIYYLLDKQI